MMRSALIYSLLCTLLLTGCEDSNDRPPRVDISAANAAPGFGPIIFRRGSSQAAIVGSLAYGERVVAAVDSGTYNFSLEATDLTDPTEQIELTAFSNEVAADLKHLFVFAEQNGALLPLQFSRPVFSSEDANWELSIVHAVDGAAGVDYYVQPAGTDLTTVQPNGTVTFGTISAAATLPPGDLAITLTEAGNAANVLFASNAVTFAAGESFELVVVPSLYGTANQVSLVGLTREFSVDFVDSTAVTSIRVFNGVADALPRDVFLNGDFTTPFIDDVAFAVDSAFVDLPAGTTRISVTPGDNPSVVEVEFTASIIQGAPHNLVIAGTAGSISGVLEVDRRLPNNSAASLAVLNTVNPYTGAAVFVVDPGTDISTVNPDIILPLPAAGERTVFAPGTYDLVVAESDAGTTILGPLSITLVAGGLYGALLYDSGDGTTASILLLDDFQ